MLTLKPMPSYAELRELDKQFNGDQLLELSQIFMTLNWLQEFPDHALELLSGMYLPPHQRTMLYQAHRGAGLNVFPCSRGTSKSSLICGIYPAYVSAVYPSRKEVLLHLTGFRGGQTIFNDVELWLDGGWDSQSMPAPFLKASTTNGPRPVQRHPNQWKIQFASHSSMLTMPTQNSETILGTRAHDLAIDEAKLLSKEFVEKVAVPFLNVMTDMRHGGAYADKNRVFMVSTVDYNWRPFQDYVHAAKEGLRRDHAAYHAAKAGDWVQYESLALAGLHDYTHTRFDYTDILIRKEFVGRDGRVFDVNYPDTEIPLTHDVFGIPFTVVGEDGRIQKQSPPVDYWMTYAMDKTSLERGLRDGSAEEASWLSEQRNIVETAAGDVYANAVVDLATCAGDRYIMPYKECGEAWIVQHKESLLDYEPPVLWTCQDPCVLGVDYAPSKDFCAFTVIRIGPLAGPTKLNSSGDRPGSQHVYQPVVHHGKTTWSNVVWCEQHLKMSHREVADKIRQLRSRYNLMWFYEPHVEDHWTACRAIGIDMRGGGHGVRDELLWLNEQDLPKDAYRIYDPLDKDDKVSAFEKDHRTLPMLDAIWPSDEINDTMVDFTVAQMQQGFLYLPKWLEQSQRPQSRELWIGYEAARNLEKQLRKLRQKPTKNWRSFYMDGDNSLHTNKRDLWASFIYAAKQLRAHLIRLRTIENTPPPLGMRVTRMGSRKGQTGRAAGARYYER